ncbi:hypothetical protein [Actinomyces culturomici]|uniref:hypothetical protein n=1 Tax=Actinomyces culturomici TaxID=1926276 RepID=UPI000E20BAF5|nr:hypothetical protein [Actinomyces culturomici]
MLTPDETSRSTPDPGSPAPVGASGSSTSASAAAAPASVADLAALAREVERLGREIDRLSRVVAAGGAPNGRAVPIHDRKAGAPNLPQPVTGPIPGADPTRTAPTTASVPAPVNPWNGAPAPSRPAPRLRLRRAGRGAPPDGNPQPEMAPLAPGTATGGEPARMQPVNSTRARESRFSAYALAIAAALLVFLAASSLVVLLWDRVADEAKIQIVGALAVVLTAVGAALGARTRTESPWRNALPAATALGTGGGLGFVALIGAVLLGVVDDAPLVLSLLSIWGLALVGLGTWTRLPITWLIAAMGGAATVILTAQYARMRPESALLGLIAVLAHTAILTVLTTVAAPRCTSEERRPVYLLAAPVVAFTAIANAPIEQAAFDGELVALLAYAAFATLALAQGLIVLVAAKRTRSDRIVWNVVWTVWIVLVAGIVALRVHDWEFARASGFLQGEAPVASVGATVLVLLSILGCALAAALLPLAASYRRVTAHALSFAVVLVFIVRAEGSPLGLIGPILLVLVLLATAAPAVVDGHGDHALTVPILAAPTVLAMTAESPVAAWTGIVLGVLLIVGVALIDLSSRRAASDSPLSLEQSAVARAAAFALAFAALALLVVEVDRLCRFADIETAWRETLVQGLVLTFLSLLALLGLGTGRLSPADLIMGRGLAARVELRVPRTRIHPVATPPVGTPGAAGGPSGRAAPPEPVVPLEPVVPAAPIILAAAGVLAVSSMGMTTMWFQSSAAAGSAARTGIACLLIAVLATALVRMLLPIISRPAAGVATGFLLTSAAVMVVLLLSSDAFRMWTFNLALFLASAACILTGFFMGARHLRLFGLVVIAFALAKIVLVDIGAQGSVIRIGALLIAGIVCFGLALVYSRNAARPDGDGGLDSAGAADRVARASMARPSGSVNPPVRRPRAEPLPQTDPLPRTGSSTPATPDPLPASSPHEPWAPPRTPEDPSLG